MLNVPPNSVYAMLVVLILLALATVVTLALSFKNPQKDYREVHLRIKSWWWIVGIVFLALATTRTAAVVLFAFISFLALKEFLSIVPTRQADRRVIFWAYVSIPIQYYWVAMGWYGMFIIFIPVYVFLLLPVRMILIGDTKGFIRSAGILHWATILTVYFISHVAYLLTLPVKNADAGAVGLVLFLLVATEFNDVCQFVWGKMLGKHKIIPLVSPNKTWEGFIGGLITTTVAAAVCAPYLTFLTGRYAIIAGIIIAMSGFFGDLVISCVKRDLQIKDSGTLIPGHGGILDRLDSLFFSAPLFFHYIYYLQSRI